MNLRKQGKGLSGRNRRVQAAMKGLGGLFDLHLVGAPKRPRPLAVGQVIRGDFRIEQILRSGDHKHDYLVSCVDGSEAARRCWECGSASTAPDEAYCDNCGMPLSSRSFMLSERWRGRPEVYEAMTQGGFFHPSVARYYDVFKESERLYVLTDLVEGSFLASTPGAHDAKTLIDVIAQVASALRFLEDKGVRVAAIGREHIGLIAGEAMLVDPEIAPTADGRGPERYRGRLVEQFGQVLRQFSPYDAPELRRLLDEMCEGRYDSWEGVLAQVDPLRAAAERGLAATGSLGVAAMSDVGMARLLNEDIWGWERLDDDITLFAVADGMGGHDNGEVASDLAVRALMVGVQERLEGRRSPSMELLESLLDAASQGANNAVKEFSEQRRTDMGTTLVSALVYRHELAFVANVGDSRAYLYRDGALVPISQDHSLVANLVAMGKITPEAARNHPHANILVRTIGKEWDVEIDVFRQPLKPGDALLLCSDGLWGEVEDDEIASILHEFPNPRAACKELIAAANQHGGRDNITAILVQIP